MIMICIGYCNVNATGDTSQMFSMTPSLILTIIRRDGVSSYALCLAWLEWSVYLKVMLRDA